MFCVPDLEEDSGGRTTNHEEIPNAAALHGLAGKFDGTEKQPNSPESEESNAQVERDNECECRLTATVVGPLSIRFDASGITYGNFDPDNIRILQCQECIAMGRTPNKFNLEMLSGAGGTIGEVETPGADGTVTGYSCAPKQPSILCVNDTIMLSGFDWLVEVGEACYSPRIPASQVKEGCSVDDPTITKEDDELVL